MEGAHGRSTGTVLPSVRTDQVSLDFSLFYRVGIEDEGRRFVSSLGIPASVQVMDADVYALELAWANIQGTAMDAAESESRIGLAMRYFALHVESVEG